MRFNPLPGRKFFDGLTESVCGLVLGSRYRQNLLLSRGVAVELPTPRQGKNVSHSHLIGGVGVPLK